MASYCEPMDIDEVEPDNKENAIRHNGAPPSAMVEEGEDLDVSELNMKLRLSCTPLASPAPARRPFTGSSKKLFPESGDSNSLNTTADSNLNITLTEFSMGDYNGNSPLSQDSTNSTMNSQKEDQNENTTALHQSFNDTAIISDCTINNNVTVTMESVTDSKTNIAPSEPLSSAPLVESAEAEISKTSTSPIMRGLKSVLSIFRQSQSPITSAADIMAVSGNINSSQDITSPNVCISHDNITFPVSVLASTPVHGDEDLKRAAEHTSFKESSPHLPDSIVFHDDLVNDLQWNDDSTIVFNKNKFPGRKLYTPSLRDSNSSSGSYSRDSVPSTDLLRDESDQRNSNCLGEECEQSRKIADSSIENMDVSGIDSNLYLNETHQIRNFNASCHLGFDETIENVPESIDKSAESLVQDSMLTLKQTENVEMVNNSQNNVVLVGNTTISFNKSMTYGISDTTDILNKVPCDNTCNRNSTENITENIAPIFNNHSLSVSEKSAKLLENCEFQLNNSNPQSESITIQNKFPTTTSYGSERDLSIENFKHKIEYVNNIGIDEIIGNKVKEILKQDLEPFQNIITENNVTFEKPETLVSRQTQDYVEIVSVNTESNTNLPAGQNIVQTKNHIENEETGKNEITKIENCKLAMVDLSIRVMKNCEDEEFVASENNSPYVSLNTHDANYSLPISKTDEIDFDAIENPFVTKCRVSTTPPPSEINFDAIENPFVTKFRVSTTPPPSEINFESNENPLVAKSKVVTSPNLNTQNVEDELKSGTISCMITTNVIDNHTELNSCPIYVNTVNDTVDLSNNSESMSSRSINEQNSVVNNETFIDCYDNTFTKNEICNISNETPNQQEEVIVAMEMISDKFIPILAHGEIESDLQDHSDAYMSADSSGRESEQLLDSESDFNNRHNEVREVQIKENVKNFEFDDELHESLTLTHTQKHKDHHHHDFDTFATKTNISLSLCNVQKHFNANIIQPETQTGMSQTKEESLLLLKSALEHQKNNSLNIEEINEAVGKSYEINSKIETHNMHYIDVSQNACNNSFLSSAESNPSSSEQNNCALTEELTKMDHEELSKTPSSPRNNTTTEVEIAFEDIENPFATKNKIRISPPVTPVCVSDNSFIQDGKDSTVTKRKILFISPLSHDFVCASENTPVLENQSGQDICLASAKNEQEVIKNNDTFDLSENIQDNMDANSANNADPQILVDTRSQTKLGCSDNDETISSGSSNLSGNTDLTMKEVGTEDEDTIEGPDFCDLESENTDNTLETKSKIRISTPVLHKKITTEKSTPKVIQCSDEPILSSKEIDFPDHEFVDCTNEDFKPGELFINAESFDFLMSQNNAKIDSGKESLFLKFDPLCANNRKSTSNTPTHDKNKKAPFTETIDEHIALLGPEPNETTVIKSSQFLLKAQDNICSGKEQFDLSAGSSSLEKPMMVVVPAVNNEQTVTTRTAALTPIRPERRSMTFSSPAIAAIDRLISLSGNSSPASQSYFTENRDPNHESNEAIIELRGLLVEKEFQVEQLRLEARGLQERLTNLEVKMNSLQEDNDKRLEKINDLQAKLTHKTALNMNMAAVVEEYERVISSMMGENEQEKQRHDQEKAMLIRERDEQVAHLNSMEVSFSDLHTKYERTKQVISTYKANEEALRKTIAEYKDSQQKLENNCEVLKQQAMSKLNTVTMELEKQKRGHESEVLKLNALVKRKEMHATSLEETLAQKIKANEELTAICDELISKVG